MSLDPIDLVQHVAQALSMLIGAMMIAAFLEAALGLGVIVPGESVIVLGAAAVAAGAADWVIPTAVLVAAAACAGDHVGWSVGRRTGPALRRSAVVDRIGTRHWDRAMAGAARQRMVTLIVLRQLPGVRTLVAAALGAGGVKYSRFLLTSVIGALVWSLLWVLGGAAVGSRILEILGPWFPALIVTWLVLLGVLSVHRKRSPDREVNAR